MWEGVWLRDVLAEAGARPEAAYAWSDGADSGSFDGAPMGPANDPFAVADQHGRVHGIAGLWIADAFLMPRGVSVPPNLTLIMMGERIASWLCDDTRR